MLIDQKKIKMSFTTETSQKIELGQEVELTIKAVCVQEIAGDNQDGSVNMKYVLKPLTVELK
jgi:hypothetical protein